MGTLRDIPQPCKAQAPMTNGRRIASWFASALLLHTTAADAQSSRAITVDGLGAIAFPVSTTSTGAGVRLRGGR